MNHPKSTKISPSSRYDNFNQNYWASCPQDEEGDDQLQQLYNRIPLQVKLKKHTPALEKKGLGYIDNSIMISNVNDPTALNNKLQKFFKTLTKNYRPKTPLSKEKSPRSCQLSVWQDDSDSYPEPITPYQSSLRNPVIANKLYEQMQKSSSQAEMMTGYGPLSQNEELENLLDNNYDQYMEENYERGGMGNRHMKYIPQDRVKDTMRRHENSAGSCYEKNSRSKSNPARHLQDEQAVISARNNYRISNNIPVSNPPSHENSLLPCFNQNFAWEEENCNYAYMKDCQKEIEQSKSIYNQFKPNKEFPMVPSDEDFHNYPKSKPPTMKHNSEDLLRKKDPKEIAQSSQRSNLKDWSGDITTTDSSKKYTKTSEERTVPNKADPYDHLGNGYRNLTFSEQEEEEPIHFHKHPKSIVGGPYSSTVSGEGKDENPNYTNVKLLYPSNKGITESLSEPPQPFSKRSNLGNSLPHSTDDKLRTMSQLTDILDSSDEMYIKQKSCFDMFFVLCNAAFQRLNLGFQSVKRASLAQQTPWFKENFSSFGNPKIQENKDLNTCLKGNKKEGLDLGTILQGYIKINGMFTVIQNTFDRDQRFFLEKLRLNRSLYQIQHKNRINSGCLLLSSFCSSRRRSLLTHSLASWKSTATMQKLKEAERNRIQQLTQTFSFEKENLLNEILVLKKKLNVLEKTDEQPQKQQPKDISAFLRGIEIPQVPFKTKEDSMECSRSINQNMENIEKENAHEAPVNYRAPLSLKIQSTSQAIDAKEKIKMLNGDIKRLLEQGYGRQEHTQPANNNNGLMLNGQKVLQNRPKPDLNQLVASKRGSTQDGSKLPQDYIERLKRQSNEKYDQSILSPSDSVHGSEQYAKETTSDYEEEIDSKIQDVLGKVLIAFGPSHPLELTEGDYSNTDRVPKNNNNNEPKEGVSMTFLESLKGFAAENMERDESEVSVHESKFSLSLDQSEIMKEGTGNMKGIREITKDIMRGFTDNSGFVSEDGTPFFHK